MFRARETTEYINSSTSPSLLVPYQAHRGVHLFKLHNSEPYVCSGFSFVLKTCTQNAHGCVVWLFSKSLKDAAMDSKANHWRRRCTKSMFLPRHACGDKLAESVSMGWSALEVYVT
jgi:hypothetical protein